MVEGYLHYLIACGFWSDLLERFLFDVLELESIEDEERTGDYIFPLIKIIEDPLQEMNFSPFSLRNTICILK